MKLCKPLIFVILVLLVGVNFCQEIEEIQTIKLSGLRIGMTYMPGNSLKRVFKDSTVVPIISQFGWQFEKQFPAGKAGLSAVLEVIPLLGGMNLGVFIPSMSVLIGIRTKKGYELGAGPQISLAGTKDSPRFGAGMVFGAGMTKKIGNLYIPLNFAVAQGKATGEEKSGLRLTLITGFAFK